MSELKEPKVEETTDDYRDAFNHEDVVAESSENPENPNPSDPKAPAWFPSSKGRSIVWEHITWVPQSQRAACNYCPAEFQIKGGTSALLRHLKTIHPAAINFDPDNPPPIIRRKKRKMMEDYTIVTEDTKSYMDNLLEQFLQDDTVQRIHPGPSTSPSPAPILHTQPAAQPQSRADSEIDEVIRSLKKETAQNGQPVSEQQPDQDLRKLLGMDDRQCEEVIATVSTGGGATNGGAEPIQQQQQQIMMNPDEEKQVTSSSGSAKKRKMEEALMMKPMEMSPGLNSGKFPMSILSAIRRPPPPPHHQLPHHLPHHQNLFSTATSSPPTVLPPTVLLNQPMIPQGGVPAIPAKYNAHAVQILDFEAKVLYNQSLHSTIAREDAMCTYYRMKSRKMELEIKKLERELGEEQDDPQDE